MPSLFERWTIDAALDARRPLPDSIRARAAADPSLRASLESSHRLHEMLRAPGAMPVVPSDPAAPDRILAAIDEAPHISDAAGGSDSPSWAGWAVFAVSSISVVLASAWLTTRMTPAPSSPSSPFPAATRAPASPELETPDVILPPLRPGEGTRYQPPPPGLRAARSESRPAEGLSTILPSPLRTAPAIIRSLLTSPKQSIAAVVEAPVQREARLLAEDSRKLADSLLAPLPFTTLPPPPPSTPGAPTPSPSSPGADESEKPAEESETQPRHKPEKAPAPVPPQAPDAPR